MKKTQHDFIPKEYKQLLKAYRKHSDRHVVVLEANLLHQDKCKVFHVAELERKAGNELVAGMKNNYEQLIRTKRYRKLKSLYGEASEAGDEARRKAIGAQMSEMQKTYNVTWDFCRKSMIPIGKKYWLNSIFALTKAEDVWRAVENCLYGNGEGIHFAKRGELPAIRAKQINRGIVVSSKDDVLRFRFGELTFGVMVKDKFEQDEVNAILSYLAQPDEADALAIHAYQKDRICLSTYRPCYASLVCKEIRGNLRVHVHITIEGKVKPKFDKDGNLRHAFGKGVVGCDIGTQTFAYVSKGEVGLKNLAERGTAISVNEKKERRIYRAMDRSRRAMNPGNYNEDGTVKKGRRTWKSSNKYKKLKKKHSELCRINAENRRFAINEDINHLRSLGDVFITEPKNAKKLQKRVKETTMNKSGKPNRKKRFGKSVKNRCPGYFQAQAERKFPNTGGVYIEVANNYRASQYDHTADQYIPKKLSMRMFNLSDGTPVQRDMYSAFLLFHMDRATGTIGKEMCKKNFECFFHMEEVVINEIKCKKIQILNSGIKVA